MGHRNDRKPADLTVRYDFVGEAWLVDSLKGRPEAT